MTDLRDLKDVERLRVGVNPPATWFEGFRTRFDLRVSEPDLRVSEPGVEGFRTRFLATVGAAGKGRESRGTKAWNAGGSTGGSRIRRRDSVGLTL